MTIRTDIVVDFQESPRIIDITTASESLNVQDSHDTLTTIQDSEEGGQFPDLVSSSGGEDLGAGVTVGLTTVLSNCQYAFQPTTPQETGTITTGGTTLLIDAVATFQTNLVKRGDWVINFTDRSVTEVLSVDSEIQLTTRGLRNGIGNTFDVADVYHVYEVLEAELGGGNFLAVDDMAADLNPAFPSFGRFYTKTSSSSATQVSSADVAAIKVVTDKFTFTVANRVDTNVRYVNSQIITGDGSGGDPFQGA